MFANHGGVSLLRRTPELASQIPMVWFWLGAMDPVKLSEATAQGKSLPTLHSSRFAPLPEATLRTGVTAMTGVALSLLKK